jgi:hypothetical protein
MKIIYEYSHLGGSEILQVRYPEENKEIYEVIEEATAPKTKVSKEKSMVGKLLYSPTEINNSFKESFERRDYLELRDYFDIPVCKVADGPERVKSFKQVDFHKGKVLVEVQFGKYAFMFYDMAKFQYFFNENKADVGVEIVPCHYMKKKMSTGVSYGEQLINDIERLKRHFPAVPIKLILVDVD